MLQIRAEIGAVAILGLLLVRAMTGNEPKLVGAAMGKEVLLTGAVMGIEHVLVRFEFSWSAGMALKSRDLKFKNNF